MAHHPFAAIDHVQLAMPAGEEETARRFYRDLLGMAEIPKPPELAKRGGCWFESGTVQIHLGVEQDFRPAQKAHPANAPMFANDATNPKLTEGGDYIFRVCFIDPFQGKVMATFARQNLKFDRVAILKDVKNDD